MATITQTADRVVTAADRLSASFARELGRVLRRAERELALALKDLEQGRGARAIHAQQRRQEIRDVLTAAGYDALAETATGETLDTIAARVLAGRAALPLVSLARLEAMKSMQWLDLLEEGDVVTTQLWRAVMQGTVGTRPVADIVQDVAEVLETSEPRIQTLYDTAVSIYGRVVESIAAGDDPETRFAYMGPVDDKTREFCLARVGKIYSRVDIDAMDNGQIGDVFLTGGGYNCRHVWMEVSRFGVDGGQGRRFPEVQEAIDALRTAA